MSLQIARRRLAALAVLGAATLLSACAICPRTGRIVPAWSCDRANVPNESAQPVVVGGRRAEAVPGAPDAWVVAPGVSATGQPAAEAWPAYSAAGYRTIVNMRPSAEGADRERDMVVGNGMRYVHIPVDGADVHWGDADALAKLLENPANRPMLLHCSSGNRVAGVWALYESRHNGLAPQDAIAAGRAVGPMKPAVQRRLREMLGIAAETESE